MVESTVPQVPNGSRPPEGGHPQRLYVPPERLTPPIVLTGAEAHYLLHVKRCRPGEPVELFTGDGYVYRAVVAEASPSRLTLTAEGHAPTFGRAPSGRECPVPISVVVPVARARRMDTLVEKLSELGVAELWPVTTTRSVVPTRETSASRYEHWRRLAIEAARQSGRATLLLIREGQSLRQAARALRARRVPAKRAGAHEGGTPRLQLVASLRGEAQPLAEVLSRHPPGDTAIFIGPEGGFDPTELQELVEGGALPVSLGPTVLRVETAAIVAVAAVVLWADAARARRGPTK